MPGADEHHQAVVIGAGPGGPATAAMFTGELVHASDYRNGEPYHGRDVMVVGTGNTGAELCVGLAESGAKRILLPSSAEPVRTFEAV